MATTSIKTSGTLLTVDDIQEWADPNNIISQSGWVKEISPYGVRGLIMNHLIFCQPQIPYLITSGQEVVGDWTEELSGKLDVTVAANNAYYVPTNTTRLTNTAATNVTNYYVQNLNINNGALPVMVSTNKHQMDWRFQQYVGYWAVAQASGWDGTGELKFNIRNDGTWGTAVNVTPLASAYREWTQIDISSFARDKVEGIRFIANNSDVTNETLDIQFLIRYLIGAQGPCFGGTFMLFPVANGDTAAQGDLQNYESSVVDAGASGDFGVVGICCIGETGAVATGKQALVFMNGITPVETGGGITEGYSVMMGAAANEIVTSAGATDRDESLGRALETSAGDGAFIMIHLGAKGADDVA